MNAKFVTPSEIRAMFSASMSDMYKTEVPLYGDLLNLVSDVNKNCLDKDSALRQQLADSHELERLDVERHGAIRLGTAEELKTISRLFKVMGMEPVGYYDLSVAGVPVHSTAFRALTQDDLSVSPFRVFTSLLRLDLIEDEALRKDAQQTLAKRNIFTPGVIRLIEQCEKDDGLNKADAEKFVKEAIETFRWHEDATVTSKQYQGLHDQHRLIADVVAFKGPHINHLTPRTLDIDAVQEQMPKRGINPKAVIEGPPRRKNPILLRQTSFKALEEEVRFTDQQGDQHGSHTARFGEIEQRGAALTAKGRELYDRLLAAARKENDGSKVGKDTRPYYESLEKHFKEFPDDLHQMFVDRLAYFQYIPTKQGLGKKGKFADNVTLKKLVEDGDIKVVPIVYEDFLPVSAAGIFQSNLGENGTGKYDVKSSQQQFEKDLGRAVIDEQELYRKNSERSLADCFKALGI